MFDTDTDPSLLLIPTQKNASQLFFKHTVRELQTLTSVLLGADGGLCQIPPPTFACRNPVCMHARKCSFGNICTSFLRDVCAKLFMQPCDTFSNR